MEPEERFEELYPREHPVHAASLWPLISESVPQSLHAWLDPSLKHAWQGEQVVSLLVIDYERGGPAWFWCIAQMEFQVDLSCDGVRELCEFFKRLPVEPLPEPSEERATPQRRLWELHLRDGALLDACMGEPRPRFVGQHCSVPLCAEAPRVKGSVANHQRSEATELAAARGYFQPTNDTRLLGCRLYCAQHDRCYKELGLNPALECRGPRDMTTTRLVADGFSGDQLDGRLYCARHSPHGPRHPSMTQVKPD